MLALVEVLPRTDVCGFYSRDFSNARVEELIVQASRMNGRYVCWILVGKRCFCFEDKERSLFVLDGAICYTLPLITRRALGGGGGRDPSSRFCSLSQGAGSEPVYRQAHRLFYRWCGE